MKKSIKKEMKKRIAEDTSSNQKVQFVFDENTFQNLDWVEENEFRLNGIMYDVIKEVKSTDGNHYIQCLEDDKETWLFEELNRQSHENSAGSDKQKNMQKLLKLFSITYVAANNAFSLNESIIIIPNFFYSEHYTSIYANILSPPPKG
jgi:hypothetical protein